MAPFQALYGYAPPKWKDIITNQARVPSVKDHLEENQKVVQILKENLNTARKRMKQQADRHRTEREFEVRDWVFVRLQPYKQLSLKKCGKNKLAPQFYGLYQINKKINHVAYALELPKSSHVHNVFHVSCLKRMIGQHQQAQKLLPMLDDEGRMIFEPEYIITTIEIRLRTRVIKEYLIKWKNLPEEDATLESEQFRQLHLL